jgi:hypothetical protein
MASPEATQDDQRLSPAETGGSFGHRMLATIATLVSQPSGNISSLNNTIHITEAFLADAPVDFCIPAEVCGKMGVLYERKYRQSKDLDDLQVAITWAKQGAAVVSQYMDQAVCLSNLARYLASRYKHTGKLEDLREARERVAGIIPGDLPATFPKFSTFLKP